MAPSSGCHCCLCIGKSRKNIIRMLTFCLIQGLLWSTITIFLLAIQTCALNLPMLEDTTSVSNATNEIEFVKALILGAYLSGNCTSGNKFNDEEWPIKSHTSERTYYLLFIHGLLNALWIPLCVLLIVGVRGRFRGCLSAILLYVPWLLVTFVIIIFDIIATTYYVFDEKHTKTLLEFLLFLGVKLYSKDEIIPKSSIYDSFTMYAPLVFILYFSRGIILTLINTYFFAQMFYYTKYIAREISQPLIRDIEDYDDTGVSNFISKYKNMDENTPMPGYASASYLQWMEIYQPTEHPYEIVITPRKEYSPDNLFPTRTFQETGRRDVDSPSGDYISLINYNSEYQYAYENIWRDIKNENVTNVTHIYDYLGRPVAESKVAIKNNNNCKDVNVRKGSMLTSMDLHHVEKFINNNEINKNFTSFKKSATSCALSDATKVKNNTNYNLNESKNIEVVRDLCEKDNFCGKKLSKYHEYETIPLQTSNYKQNNMLLNQINPSNNILKIYSKHKPLNIPIPTVSIKQPESISQNTILSETIPISPDKIYTPSEIIPSCTGDINTTSSKIIPSCSEEINTTSSKIIPSCSEDINTTSSKIIPSCSEEINTTSSKIIPSCSEEINTTSSKIIPSCSEEINTTSSKIIPSCSEEINTTSTEIIPHFIEQKNNNIPISEIIISPFNDRKNNVTNNIENSSIELSNISNSPVETTSVETFPKLSNVEKNILKETDFSNTNIQENNNSDSINSLSKPIKTSISSSCIPTSSIISSNHSLNSNDLNNNIQYNDIEEGNKETNDDSISINNNDTSYTNTNLESYEKELKNNNLEKLNISEPEVKLRKKSRKKSDGNWNIKIIQKNVKDEH